MCRGIWKLYLLLSQMFLLMLWETNQYPFLWYVFLSHELVLQRLRSCRQFSSRWKRQYIWARLHQLPPHPITLIGKVRITADQVGWSAHTLCSKHHIITSGCSAIDGPIHFTNVISSGNSLLSLVVNELSQGCSFDAIEVFHLIRRSCRCCANALWQKPFGHAISPASRSHQSDLTSCAGHICVYWRLARIGLDRSWMTTEGQNRIVRIRPCFLLCCDRCRLDTCICWNWRSFGWYFS
jgi:hypothetical protein